LLKVVKSTLPTTVDVNLDLIVLRRVLNCWRNHFILIYGRMHELANQRQGVFDLEGGLIVASSSGDGMVMWVLIVLWFGCVSG
jgi:hypothetical protein